MKTKLTTTTRRHKVENSKRSQMHWYITPKGTESDICMRWIIIHLGIVYAVFSVRDVLLYL